MEVLMKKAITEFKKLNKGEIRTISVLECSGRFKKVDYAMFLIEYAETPGSEYKEIEVQVTRKECFFCER